jgi:NADPH:quinone reductase-like Zn-dependent oxidoreductase
MLVRNEVVAANPSDWKVQTFGVMIEDFPAVLGSELAGVVVSVGPGVTRFSPGDRVTGCALGVIHADSNKAAFQKYTIMNEVGTSHLPDNLTFEEGAVFPVGMITAAIAVFDGIGLPMHEIRDEKPGAIFIWSGASSTGISALQIAHSLGWPVYVAASTKHHEWLKSLGATDAWDYRDPEISHKFSHALEAAGLKLRGIFDARSDESSFESVAAIINTVDSTQGAKLTALYPWPADKQLPDGVQVHHTNCARFTEEYPHLASWLFGGWLHEKLQDGTVKVAPKPRVIEGGLEAAQKMLDTLKAGEASGEKFMLKV